MEIEKRKILNRIVGYDMPLRPGCYPRQMKDH
jgi:hypothetical protein